MFVDLFNLINSWARAKLNKSKGELLPVKDYWNQRQVVVILDLLLLGIGCDS